MNPLTGAFQREALRANVERYRDRIVPLVRLSRGGVGLPSPLDRATVQARRGVINAESCLYHIARRLAEIAQGFPDWTVASEDDLTVLVPVADPEHPSGDRSLYFESVTPWYGNRVNLILTVDGPDAPQGQVQWQSYYHSDVIYYWEVQLRPNGEKQFFFDPTSEEEEGWLLDYFIENGRFQGLKYSPDHGDEIPTGLDLEVQWQELLPLKALSRTFQRGLRAGRGGARRERRADARARRERSADPRARRAQSADRGARRTRSAD